MPRLIFSEKKKIIIKNKMLSATNLLSAFRINEIHRDSDDAHAQFDLVLGNLHIDKVRSCCQEMIYEQNANRNG